MVNELIAKLYRHIHTPKLSNVDLSATRIAGKDHWHQTAVTMFTENSPFQGYTRKTALFRATQIFQKVSKVVVNSQINVSFSPALI
jgi:hypothetical protein